MTKDSAANTKSYTKKELRAFVADIEEKVINSEGAYLHSIVALNELLRQPNAEQIVDRDLKNQIRDLWIKLKSTGVQLCDPPLLFGLPEDFNYDETTEVEDEEVTEYAEASEENGSS